MKTLKTQIFVLCDYATVSREQKLSIIGIFDQFFVADLPTTWPKMFLVGVLEGETNQEYTLTLSLTPPQKTEQDFPDRQFKIVMGNNGKANLVTELVNFPIPVAGIYKIEIKNDKAKVGDLEFRVNKTTATYGGSDLQGKKVSN